MHKDSWLLVANSSIAHLYKIEKRQALVQVKVFEHPESRLHNRDLVSDKPGRDFESVGSARHSLEPHITPKEQEFQVFAKQLADYLESARVQGEYEKLYIAANPTLLGLLRQSIHPSVAKLISGEVDKDMTHMKPNEIMAHFPFLF